MIKWKMELTRKIGLFGLKDLRRLAPIGDVGYENGWYPPFFGRTDMCLDVWLPKTGIVNKAYDFDAEFIYYADDGMATENIRDFANEIKGKWLQIYDTYTKMGRNGVYVSEFDADPPFKRRKIQTRELDENGTPAIRDYVYFKVKFRVNDPNTDVVLTL